MKNRTEKIKSKITIRIKKGALDTELIQHVRTTRFPLQLIYSFKFGFSNA